MSIRDDVERQELIARSVENMKSRLNGDNMTRPQEEIFRGILDHMLEMEERIEQGQVLSFLTPSQRKKVVGALGGAAVIAGTVIASVFGTGVA